MTDSEILALAAIAVAGWGFWWKHRGEEKVANEKGKFPFTSEDYSPREGLYAVLLWFLAFILGVMAVSQSSRHR